MNNRRRDLIGDAVNLRSAARTAKIGLIYLIQSTPEATKRTASGNSFIDSMTELLERLQEPFPLFDRPLFDAAALVAANRDVNSQIHIEPVNPNVSIAHGFFDRLVNG